MFTAPNQMEPLLIGDSRPAYLEIIGLASDLVESSSRLEGLVSKESAEEISRLVAGMNCYYSNLIEGANTKPLDIENALREDAGNADSANLRGLAVAHIAAWQWARSHQVAGVRLSSFAQRIHRVFYEHLSESDGGGIVPGEIRKSDVVVGKHVAPSHEALERFLSRFDDAYGKSLANASMGGISRLNAIVASMIAHHRFVWIHPFPDGNGRVARILLDSMLSACGLNESGLWSMSRGFAKTSQQYKSFLAMADQPRQGDLDGRGNLSERSLGELVKYEIRTAIDQSEFMGRMFSLENLAARARGYFHRVRTDLHTGSANLYVHALSAGSFERMKAGALTGLSERAARDVLGALVQEGFLVSDGPKGRVRAGFPMVAVGSLFPDLYPAGEVDQFLENKETSSRKFRMR